MTTKEEIIKQFSWKKNRDAESEALSRAMLQYVGQSRLADDHNSDLNVALNLEAKAIFEETKRRISNCHTIDEDAKKVVMFIVLDEEKKWYGR